MAVYSIKPSAASLLSLTAKDSIHGKGHDFYQGYRTWSGSKIHCEEGDIALLVDNVKIGDKTLKNPETIKEHFCILMAPRGGKRLRNKTRRAKKTRRTRK